MFEFSKESRDTLSLSSSSRLQSSSSGSRRLSPHSSGESTSVVSRLKTSTSLTRPWTSSATSTIAPSIAGDFSVSTSMSSLAKQSKLLQSKAKERSSPDDKAKEIEMEMNKLLEQSIILRKDGNLDEACEIAKNATKKAVQLRKHRKANSLPEPIADLNHSAFFNLALSYEANDMLEEAIKTYTYLAKQRNNPFAGRIRINMGNLEYRRQQYPKAITQYKMALDISASRRADDKSLAHKIRRNIGNAFFRMGKLNEAIKFFEDAMNDVEFDYQTGFNLLVCHLALGAIDNVKQVFTTLVDIPLSDDENVEDELVGIKKDEYDARLKEANHFVLTSARLIAPKLNIDDWAAGYDWVCNTLDENHGELAVQMRLELATQRLKRGDFNVAVKQLKTLQKKSKEVKIATATNLSFVNFLEGNIEGASKYADTAVQSSDGNNVNALVNKGNTLFMSSEFDSAKELYNKAIDIQADCAQAIFNLGLVEAQLGNAEEAVEAFEKVHRITPNDSSILYQIADIYELQGRPQDAIKWFSVLTARLNDPEVLTRLGQLHTEANDESQALHYQLESFRHYPIDLDVISSIGTFFVKQEMYERSLYFFQQAQLVEPKQIKWGLMIASAHKRCDNHNAAFIEYKKLHENFPESEECLRHLIETSEHVGESSFVYEDKLDKLLRLKGT